MEWFILYLKWRPSPCSHEEGGGCNREDVRGRVVDDRHDNPNHCLRVVFNTNPKGARMSVVVWDGKTLAADKQGTVGEVAITVTKLWKLEDGTIVGAVGDAFEGIGLKDWFASGADPDKWDPDNETMLIVAKDGECKFCAQIPVFIPVEDPFMAWGAGADIALGAMMMGANAVKAVGIVCSLSVSCGCGIDSFPCGQKRSKK